MTVARILREIDQIKRANMPEELKAKFLAQKQAELETMASALPAPPAPPKTTK
jgi:hypothetical protein